MLSVRSLAQLWSLLGSSLKRGDDMTHRAKCNVWMRKYLKAMNKNFVIAFGMGYEDGAAGKERQAPPFPEAAQSGTLVYAATLFAQEAYNKGYSFGKEETK